MPFFGFLHNKDNDDDTNTQFSHHHDVDAWNGVPQRISVTPNTLAPGEPKRDLLGPIEAIDLEITVIAGQQLTPKDRSFFGLGKLSTSDPYAKVYLCQGEHVPGQEHLTHKLKLGKTRTVYRTLNPVWNETILGSLRGTLALRNHSARHPATLEVHVLDEDQLSKSDAMGFVTINIPIAPRNLDFTEWYDIPASSAKHAKGRLQIRVQTTIRRSQILVPGSTFELGSGGSSQQCLSAANNASTLAANPNKKKMKYKLHGAVPTNKRSRGHQIIQLGLSWDCITNHKNQQQQQQQQFTEERSTVSNGSSGDDFVSGFNRPVKSNTTAVDLDASCIAVSRDGHVVMPDTVYYGNLVNSNRSVIHSGDEQVGAVDGDDESIILHLDRIPDYILCMYILLTVATPGMTLSQVKSTRVRVRDITPLGEEYTNGNIAKSFQQGQTLCTFCPSDHSNSGDATAMFMVRIARDPNCPSSSSSSPTSSSSRGAPKNWVLTPMEKTHPTARDFGALIPHAKAYSRDLIPRIMIDPTERVAILRKGSNIRIHDYCRNHVLPEKITFGLGWDVSDDAAFIDLDASVICLDANLNLVDLIWWKQLHSKDYNIVHHGDEREGDEVGDDELIDVYLNNMSSMGDHCHVHYIGFVVNSYSGQKLNDVSRASCHIFDDANNTEIATYAVTNAKQLEDVTSLFVGCLYRTPQMSGSNSPLRQSGSRRTVPDNRNNNAGNQDGGGGEWCFNVISEASHGRTVKSNVEQFREYLRQHPLEGAPAAHDYDDGGGGAGDDLDGDAASVTASAMSTTSYETNTSSSLVKEVELDMRSRASSIQKMQRW